MAAGRLQSQGPTKTEIRKLFFFRRAEKRRYPIGLGARAKGRGEQGDKISAVKSPAGPQNEQKSIQP